jgi:hypothetical protein
MLVLPLQDSGRRPPSPLFYTDPARLSRFWPPTPDSVRQRSDLTALAGPDPAAARLDPTDPIRIRWIPCLCWLPPVCFAKISSTLLDWLVLVSLLSV